MQPTPPDQSVVRYVHRGSIVEAPWFSNTQTLLQHIREDRRMCGTKEGCAEGDCGACVVVIGEYSATNNSVIYRAVNACIFPLSAIDGRLLITVEDLSSSDGALHPVQQAMVECHGSQCGFCTPGFVMSLYEFYLNHRGRVSSSSVHEHLSGNLCRCTGYAPILRAAEKMYAYPRVDRDRNADAELLAKLYLINNVHQRVLRSTSDFAAFPRTVEELADTFLSHPDAILLGGSTDVGLWITKQRRAIPEVIHLSRTNGLMDSRVNRDGLVLGAAMRLTDAMSLLLREYPELRELCSRFASPPVRNAATLGGNIANGSPIGDSMPALIALGAIVLLRKGDVQRQMNLENLYLGYQRKDIEVSEFVQAIRIPVRKSNTFIRAYKVSKRFDDDISAVCCVLALELVNGYCTSARVAFGGMAATPKRATAVENALTGRYFDRESIEHAVPALTRDFAPLSDHRASSWYRMEVAGNLIQRAIAAHGGAEPTRVGAYPEFNV